jgi:predicted DCC family thiol-disulfide oxidoreductase YuxK
VLYDADCGVCRLTVVALRRVDWRRRLDLVPLQGYEPSSGGPSLADVMAELHVRDDRGRWSRGGAAVIRIAEAVPLLVGVALVGRLPGARGLVDRGYRLVADHRGEISRVLRLDRCAPSLRTLRGGPS